MIDWNGISEFSVPEGEVTNIERGGVVLWEKPSAGMLIYNGGATLEGEYKNTEELGYLYYKTPGGYVTNTEYYESMISDFSYAFITPPIETIIEADKVTFEWSVGAFTIPVDLTNWSRVVITVSYWNIPQVGARSQLPYCQIVDSYSDLHTDLSDRYSTIPGKELTGDVVEIDVSNISGQKYLRIIGDVKVTKILLDNEPVSA